MLSWTLPVVDQVRGRVCHDKTASSTVGMYFVSVLVVPDSLFSPFSYLSHTIDHQHIARMQSEIYLVDMFRPKTVVIIFLFVHFAFTVHLGTNSMKGLYQNCEIYNPQGSGFAPRGGQT
jgi:hypothetical protein